MVYPIKVYIFNQEFEITLKSHGSITVNCTGMH